MKKESGMVQLLDAEWHRSCALLMVQVSIEAGEFDEAMGCQFEYLYWHDEFIELLDEHHNEWWQLKLAALGLDTHV